ncbi:hypothetical protein K469DRAFT_232535 [Zopfia rhizophila CBS 207.26]|uniref:Uncharacterized protein n=1 Tax=Zopfia rhizophila CBS 207.26 TaxID=1314779 RepID=A0A6A6DXG4_9PEZI|nr:hypothetical protein K469DRAFT_232535 [Zopfia rhizophila CBS 207.26]
MHCAKQDTWASEVGVLVRFSSPWPFLGWAWLEWLKRTFLDLQVVMKPILLGITDLRDWGTQPPNDCHTPSQGVVVETRSLGLGPIQERHQRSRRKSRQEHQLLLSRYLPYPDFNGSQMRNCRSAYRASSLYVRHSHISR